MNRKRIVLAGLLVILALCLVYAYLAMPRLEKAPPRTAATREKPLTATASGRTADTSSRIAFGEPASEPLEFSGAERDIFRFKQRRQVQSAAKLPVVTPPPDATATPEVPSTDTVPFATVQAELSRFTFLGFLEKAGERSVFLTSGGTLFIAKPAETFGVESEFTVAAIDGNILKVKRAGNDSLVEIPLIERQHLAASVSAPARLAPLSSPAGAMPLRSFTPRPKPAVPMEGAGADVTEPVIQQESNPTEQPAPEPPAVGDVIEGEVNGKKQ